jgi:ribose transport system permease protein
MNRRLLRQALPFLSLAIVLAATFYVQPRTMSYFGLNLMLQYAVPIALATIAQMFIITVNDLDLSIGPFVGLVSCVGATLLFESPAWAWWFSWRSSWPMARWEHSSMCATCPPSW